VFVGEHPSEPFGDVRAAVVTIWHWLWAGGITASIEIFVLQHQKSFPDVVLSYGNAKNIFGNWFSNACTSKGSVG
jgi:hypothetical protein